MGKEVCYNAGMKMIVGLGNPGEEYEKTRHNVGFIVLDALLQMQESKLKNPSILAGRQNDSLKVKNKWQKSKSGLLEYVWVKGDDEDLELVKPLTYMNRSGDAVNYAMKKHAELTMKDLYVIHDDLDIRLGEYKVGWRKGPKVHNGVNSVERTLRTAEFWRVRVGVDNRNVEEGYTIPGEKYVLSRFTEPERKVIDNLLPVIVEDMVRRITTS